MVCAQVTGRGGGVVVLVHAQANMGEGGDGVVRMVHARTVANEQLVPLAQLNSVNHSALAPTCGQGPATGKTGL
jgi:hypothetical protein